MPEPSRDGWKYMPAEQPHECSECKKPLLISDEISIWFRTGPDTLHTFCLDCQPKWELVRAPQVIHA